MRELISKSNLEEIYQIVFQRISGTFSYHLKAQYLQKLLMKFEEEILYGFEKLASKQESSKL